MASTHPLWGGGRESTGRSRWVGNLWGGRGGGRGVYSGGGGGGEATGRGNWGGGAEHGRGNSRVSETGEVTGALGEGRKKEVASLGTGESSPKVQFCPLPHFVPTDENSQTEQGKKPSAHLLSSRQRLQGCKETDLRRGDREVQGSNTWAFWGAGAGLLDPRSWRPESLGPGCRRALWGVIAKTWGGAAGCSRTSLGWVGRLIRGSAPRRKAGVPTASTRSSGFCTQAGTAVEVPRAGFTRHHLQGLGTGGGGWVETKRDTETVSRELWSPTLGTCASSPFPQTSAPFPPSSHGNQTPKNCLPELTLGMFCLPTQ